MKKSLPYKVDVNRLCKTGSVVTGMLTIDKLARLRDLLANGSGEIQAELQFFVDESKHLCMSGSLTGQLQLTCQRCLEPMDSDLSLSLNWILVETEDQIDETPKGFEPVFYQEGMLPLVDSLEDELILALPLIAKHDLEECSARQWVETKHKQMDNPEEESEIRENNPFSKLKELQPK
jgi:uncharacterized protein